MVCKLQRVVFLLGKRFQKYSNLAANLSFLRFIQRRTIGFLVLVQVFRRHIVNNLVEQPIQHLFWRVQRRGSGILGGAGKNPDIFDFFRAGNIKIALLVDVFLKCLEDSKVLLWFD